MYGEIDKMIDSIDSPDMPSPFAGTHFKDENGEYVHQKMYKESSGVNGKNKSFRTAAVVALGGKCLCCGEDDWNVLDIDHVNGDGKDDRTQTARQKMFKMVARGEGNGRYQLLCANCHRRKTAKDAKFDSNKYKPSCCT